MRIRWHKWCGLALFGSACSLNPQPELPLTVGSNDSGGASASAGSSNTAGSSANAAGSGAIDLPCAGGSVGGFPPEIGEAGASGEGGASGDAGAGPR